MANALLAHLQVSILRNPQPHLKVARIAWGNLPSISMHLSARCESWGIICSAFIRMSIASWSETPFWTSRERHKANMCSVHLCRIHMKYKKNMPYKYNMNITNKGIQWAIILCLQWALWHYFHLLAPPCMNDWANNVNNYTVTTPLHNYVPTVI